MEILALRDCEAHPAAHGVCPGSKDQGIRELHLGRPRDPWLSADFAPELAQLLAGGLCPAVELGVHGAVVVDHRAQLDVGVDQPDGRVLEVLGD
eukprot:4029310-Pyramimonas_sp.AAC.2